MTRNVLWPDDPDASLQRSGGKMLGDLAGYVGRVDREARTVDISTSPLGIRPVVLVVTNETAIVVNGKQGAIGDLWKDLPVRVFYEVRDNARYATSIQVTSGDALAASPGGRDATPAGPAPVSAPTPAAPVASTAPPSTVTRPAAAPSAAPGSPARPSAPAASTPAASTPTQVAPPAVPVVPAAARIVEPTPAKAPATSAAASPATESASVGSSRATRPAPAEPDADGSAAIDWLLKGAGRR